jgi:hypothetical protein
VYKGDRLGLFWFNVALMRIYFLAGILAVAWAIIDPSAFPCRTPDRLESVAILRAAGIACRAFIVCGRESR